MIVGEVAPATAIQGQHALSRHALAMFCGFQNAGFMARTPILMAEEIFAPIVA
jgi:hypothetical protein